MPFNYTMLLFFKIKKNSFEIGKVSVCRALSSVTVQQGLVFELSFHAELFRAVFDGP